MNVLDFREMKSTGKRISMITCYDYWSARIVEQSDIDCILVGDSLAMVMHGHENTIPATVEMMATHVQAVSSGARSKFIVADMPFLSVRKGLEVAMNSVHELMTAGAKAVKIEGVDGHDEIIHHIIESGVPVMGHLGLTPQSLHQIGGYRIQGNGEKAADTLRRQAERIQELGCFALVLECVKQTAVSSISRELEIPTIGIGAGAAADGQVLVLHDMLGLYADVKPRFVRKYVEGFELFKQALNQFDTDVKSGEFPSEEESYG